MNNNKCAVLFSGGTDSTCVAAICAKKFSEIHLVTFYEFSTKHTPTPTENIKRLRTKYPNVTFKNCLISTDSIVRFINYNKYLRHCLKFGALNLATCGFSSLSWHTRMIVYCKENGIDQVFDGITNEMTHLPGHMSTVLEEFKIFYKRFQIDYSNPVRDWEIPDEQNLMDKLLVDQHGFVPPSQEAERQLKKTTGQFLYNEGIFTHPNVKGSNFDRKMQHDCYPFVAYNIMAFWMYLNFTSYAIFSQKVARVIKEKIYDLVPEIESYMKTGTSRIL
jgi:hypothetical protein